ncbi:MAG: OsmC family protein [Ferruginibacter sp.]
MADNKIFTTWQPPMQFNASIDTHTLVMDAGAADGGLDAGAGPKKLMLASLAGCTGIDIVLILQKMKVTFSAFRIDVTGTLTDTHPRTYEAVHISYSIHLPEVDKDKMEKAVTLSMDKYCGVSAMFSKFATLTHSITFS